MSVKLSQRQNEAIWNRFQQHNEYLNALSADDMQASRFWTDLHKMLSVNIALIGNHLSHENDDNSVSIFLDAYRNMGNALSKFYILYLNNGQIPKMSDEQVELLGSIADSVYDMLDISIEDLHHPNLAKEMQSEHAKLKAALKSRYTDSGQNLSL